MRNQTPNLNVVCVMKHSTERITRLIRMRSQPNCFEIILFGSINVVRLLLWLQHRTPGGAKISVRPGNSPRSYLLSNPVSRTCQVVLKIQISVPNPGVRFIQCLILGRKGQVDCWCKNCKYSLV